jgi:hypothetical protein
MLLRFAAAPRELSPAIRTIMASIFFSAARPFNVMEGQCFSDPQAAERVARILAKNGSLPHNRQLARRRRDTGPRRFG